MSSAKPIALTESEVVARIDHKLAPRGTALYRKPRETSVHPEGIGSYDLIEVATNHLVRKDIDLEALAWEVGALTETEYLQA